jgi:hypothetical protein
VKHADAFERASGLIASNQLDYLPPKPVINSVSEVLSLWQVRQKITDMTGFAIPGAQILIQNLSKLSEDSEVEQFGFTGDRLAGSLFFDHKTGAFLGDTIVERRAKSQETLDLEAQLLQPSRKSA